jgi:hypothetical protein
MVEANRPDDHSDGQLVHPSVRHEPSDASYRWVLGILIAAAVLGVIIHVVVLRFFFNYRAYEDAVKRSDYPLAPAPSTGLPPEPRLEQLNRLADVDPSNVYLRQEAREEILNSYGPTREEGYIHIPIDRAMTLLEDRLPVRKEQPADDQASRANGLVNAGESNSGRMLRGKP